MELSGLLLCIRDVLNSYMAWGLAVLMMVFYNSVSQPVVHIPPGVQGMFRRGKVRDIKNTKLWLFYHFLPLSHFNLFIVSRSTVYIPFIVKYVRHTVITEFVFCLVLHCEHISYREMHFGVLRKIPFGQGVPEEKRLETTVLQYLSGLLHTGHEFPTSFIDQSSYHLVLYNISPFS
jgi:hypothetical protein